MNGVKCLSKSTKPIVARRFFKCTPSRILRIVKISDVVDLFLRQPFCMLSILGSMQLHFRALYILAAMDVSVIPQ